MKKERRKLFEHNQIKIAMIAVIIFWFSVSTVGRAETYRKLEKDETSGKAGALYNNNINLPDKEVSEDYSAFFRNSIADNPGERPGNGEGIGQEGEEAPLKDGLPVLLACCFAMIVVKSFQKESPLRNKFRRKN